jgi:hypothetical protein
MTAARLFYTGLLALGLTSCTKPVVHKLKAYKFDDDKKQVELLFQDNDKLVLSLLDKNKTTNCAAQIGYVGKDKLVIADCNDSPVYYFEADSGETGAIMYALGQKNYKGNDEDATFDIIEVEYNRSDIPTFKYVYK